MAWYVYVGFLVASYAYHRWIAEKPPRPKPASEVGIPKIDEGSNAPLIYGRCRVRSPVLAWATAATATEVPISTSPSGFEYRMDMLMILGIPFERGVCRLWNMWSGDMKLVNLGHGGNDSVNGIRPWTGIVANASSPTQSGRFVSPKPRETGHIGGYVQLYDGNAAQPIHTLSISPYTGVSHLGVAMRTSGVAGPDIPGFRGYLAACHFHEAAIARWQIGGYPDLGTYSYDVSSYPGDSNAYNVGLEANPARVIEDILTGAFGKLAIPASKIHAASFGHARIRLQEEGNGYSRAIEAGTDANEVIREILEQIDGVLYEDNRDGLIHLKLIRADYDPSALLHITTSNCEALEGFSAGGWEGVANKVRVVFSNRQRDYQETAATAHNQAAAGDGESREIVLRMPGVCTQQLANVLAARELAARSRPIAKCSAIVSRDFYQVAPGDPIRLTWPEYGVDGRVFRVAAVNRGTLENGRIRLDLVEDFLTWRGALQPGSPFEPFPGEVDGVFSVS